MSDMKEFKDAVRDIALYAPKLDSPYDRVRVAEWTRRLTSETQKGNISNANQYLQYLRIQVRSGNLQPPFDRPPGMSSLLPFTSCVSREIYLQSKSLPVPGPIAPYLCRKSPDGHAVISAKQVPGKGVLCYLAVSTQNMNE